MEQRKADKVYFVTGGAGFIGFHLSKKLLEEGVHVIGLDNMNGYYEVGLKEDRIAILKKYPRYCFVEKDLVDKEAVMEVFEEKKPA